LVLGGIIPEGKAPLSGKILVDLEPGMEAFDNELWSGGLVMRALLTNKQFAIWFLSIHGNIKRGEISFTIEAGSSFVNKLVVSDPRLPLAELKKRLRKRTSCLWNLNL
jgi:succinate-semialdehyde dehydrogenase/glutarate-semialdehyde dehydrogenase